MMCASYRGLLQRLDRVPRLTIPFSRFLQSYTQSNTSLLETLSVLFYTQSLDSKAAYIDKLKAPSHSDYGRALKYLLDRVLETASDFDKIFVDAHLSQLEEHANTSAAEELPSKDTFKLDDTLGLVLPDCLETDDALDLKYVYSETRDAQDAMPSISTTTPMFSAVTSAAPQDSFVFAVPKLPMRTQAPRVALPPANTAKSLSIDYASRAASSGKIRPTFPVDTKKVLARKRKETHPHATPPVTTTTFIQRKSRRVV